MSIRSTQIARIANQVIEEFLQQGHYPNVNSVVAGVATALGISLPGTPVSQPLVISPGSQTNQKQLTTAAINAISDLSDLYNESIDEVNRLVRNFDYKRTRQDRARQRMISLQNRLVTSNVDNTVTYIGKMSGFDVLDPSSNAVVDMDAFTVGLPPSGQVIKLDLSTAQISFSPGGTTLSSVGTLTDILDDTKNTGYLAQISGSLPLTSSLTLNLASGSIFSCVRLRPFTGAAKTLTLTLDSQVIGTQSSSYGEDVLWTFPSGNFSTINIEIISLTPDDILGNIDLGFENLSVTLENYGLSGLMRTQPINFGNTAIGTLTLSADTSIPPNTSIAWQVGFGTQNQSFTSITPGVPLTINTAQIQDNKRVYPSQTVNSFCTVEDISSDQVTQPIDGDLLVRASIRGSRAPLFNLCRISAGITDKLSYVRRGRDAWKVTSYHYDTNEAGVVSNPEPTINDFYSPRGQNPILQTRYMPNEQFINMQFPGLSQQLLSALRLPATEYPTQSATDCVMHLFEATLELDATLAPSILALFASLNIPLPDIFAGNRAAIYLNGNQLAVNSTILNGSLVYTTGLPLQPGNNLIQIVTNNYIALGGQAFDFAGLAEGNSPFLADGGGLLWYGDPGPMTACSLFELQYQTSRDDYSRYAITNDTTTNKQVIVVRELPTTCYDVQTQVPGIKQPIILQAQLMGSPADPSLTPTISGFTLQNSFTFDSSLLGNQTTITLGV